MNFDDFKQWMDAAQAAFPSLKQWLGGQSVDDRKATWKLWRSTMDDVSLDKGHKALEKLIANVKLQPFGGKWEQLPGIILGLCGAMSALPKGRRDCICGGTGIVLVGVKYQANTFDQNPLRVIQINGLDHCGPIGAACLCSVGEWVNESRQRKYDHASGPKMLPKYDPKRMTVWHGTDLIFKDALEEQERRMMAQTVLDFGP